MIKQCNSAPKIEALKRVRRAAGDETSADKRQEKREGDGQQDSRVCSTWKFRKRALMLASKKQKMQDVTCMSKLYVWRFGRNMAEWSADHVPQI